MLRNTGSSLKRKGCSSNCRIALGTAGKGYIKTRAFRMASLGGGTSAGRVRSGSNKRPGQELDRAAPVTAAGSMPDQQMATGYTVGEVPLTPVPLKYVVQEAVKRWFEDTYQEATRGDVKQQALLGQMYAEGYGCEKDLKAAQEWMEKAAARGYRMKGVYCEL